MYRTFGRVMPLFLVMGCAGGAVDADRDVLLGLKQEPHIRVVVYRPPTFHVSTPGNSVVGSVPGVSGGALALPGGPSGDAMTDPARVVARDLSEALMFELGLDNLQPQAEPRDDDGPASLAAAFGDGLVLDVKTVRWGLSPDPELWTRYLVQYEARSRLVRLRDGRIVWQATCDGSERDAPRGSTIGELTATEALALQDKLYDAANRCARDLVTRLFARLPPPPPSSP